jgi:hypothetical protein
LTYNWLVTLYQLLVKVCGIDPTPIILFPISKDCCSEPIQLFVTQKRFIKSPTL